MLHRVQIDRSSIWHKFKNITDCNNVVDDVMKLESESQLGEHDLFLCKILYGM